MTNETASCTEINQLVLTQNKVQDNGCAVESCNSSIKSNANLKPSQDNTVFYVPCKSHGLRRAIFTQRI